MTIQPLLNFNNETGYSAMAPPEVFVRCDFELLPYYACYSNTTAITAHSARSAVRVPFQLAEHPSHGPAGSICALRFRVIKPAEVWRPKSFQPLLLITLLTSSWNRAGFGHFSCLC
jgi:hypothetical protein